MSDPDTRIIVVPEIVNLDAGLLLELKQAVADRMRGLAKAKRDVQGGHTTFADEAAKINALTQLNAAGLRCEKLLRMISEQHRITEAAERSPLS